MPVRITEMSQMVELTIDGVSDTDSRQYPPYPSKDRIVIFLHDKNQNSFYALFSYSYESGGVELDVTPESELSLGDKVWLGFISDTEYKRIYEEETRLSKALIERKDIEELHKLVTRYPDVARNLVSRKDSSNE